MNKDTIEDKVRAGGAYSVGLNGVAVVDNTFWFDFSIADVYGESAIKDTYARSFDTFKKNIEYMTALAIVLNHKSWYWYDKKDDKKSELYAKLYHKIDQFILDGEEDDDDYKYKNFTSEEITYYARATD